MLLYEKSLHSRRAFEIGVYVGHSLLLMLLANPYLKVTAIDISDENAGPAIVYLRKIFPMRKLIFCALVALQP